MFLMLQKMVRTKNVNNLPTMKLDWCFDPQVLQPTGLDRVQRDSYSDRHMIAGRAATHLDACQYHVDSNRANGQPTYMIMLFRLVRCLAIQIISKMQF